MVPIPLPVSDIPTMWWWLVTPGVVLATSAGVVMSRIEERLSVSKPARQEAIEATPDGAPHEALGRTHKPDVAAA